MDRAIDVALILWNQDIIDLVAWVLQHRNLRSIGVEPSAGDEKIESLIRSLSPTVVVFDLGPPYVRSTQAALRLLNHFPDRLFVMTCADKTMVLKTAPWLSHHALLQKPYEMEDIANMIRVLVTSAGGSQCCVSVYGPGARLAIH